MSYPSSPRDADTFVQTKRFEVDQYVRVKKKRTEIGIVSSIDKQTGDIVVSTRQGYDVVARPEEVHRAFLLVLDLNGVLVARGKGSFILRPYVDEFVRFVFQNFAVAVWTSGLERTSNPVIENVFDGFRDRLLFTMYRDSCEERPTEADPFGTIKNLRKIFDMYPKSFHNVNTIIIDDSPNKCSHPDIALCPVPFRDPVAQAEDDGLKKTMAVLEEVLQLDSHTPLIKAAEERRRELTEMGFTEETKRSAAAAPAPKAAVVLNSPSSLEEVCLWKTRLCCNYITGNCRAGNACKYLHEPDDHKRPCSRKDRCTRGHASRWLVTESDHDRSNDSRNSTSSYNEKRRGRGESKAFDSGAGGGGGGSGGSGGGYNTNASNQQQQQQQQRYSFPSTRY